MILALKPARSSVASEHNMPITVAFDFENRHLAIKIDAQNAVRVGDRLERISGYLKATISAIFKPNRRRSPTGISRCVCDLVVLARMADQLTRS